MIKAPFNFVPLADTVVFPEWADKISQDIPFSDGISGSFNVNIKALTPVFVRNGHVQGIDKHSDEFMSFNKTPAGKFFIPASSIKGELRHILEIVSFCKMQRVDNKRYSIRDVNNRQYRDSLPYDSVHCGWMTIRDDGEIEISDNGVPYRISHKEIDENLDTDFCNLFGEGVKIKDANRTAEYKYRKCSHEIFNTTFLFNEYKLYPNSAAVDRRVGVHFNNEGKIRGKIVFTGQPGNRKERRGNSPASGKFFEFVFREIESPNIYRLHYDSELYKDFEFIYKDSEDWHFWRVKAKNLGLKIPVFFKLEDNTISSIGLSYLYKLPYKQRIKDYLNDQHNSREFDMSECIFGETSAEKSLKGRVHISHAMCEDAYPFENEEGIAPYMGSPKPSYYPIYLEQQGEDGYLNDHSRFITMMDRNAKLRGWKMYPTRFNYQTEFDVDDAQLENTNPAIPLGAGSEFECCIRFHNLKDVELGAILYSVLLQKQNCHTIGFGKAFGYGACQYNIIETSGFETTDIEKFITSFIDYMEACIPNYKKSPQIKELLLMTNPHQAERLKRPLTYMELKDFVNCKQHNPRRDKIGEYLPRYSELLKPIEQKTTGPIQAEAIVTFFSGSLKKARLIEGKNTIPQILDMNGKRDKFKGNGKEKILVEITKKGLKFIKAL